MLSRLAPFAAFLFTSVAFANPSATQMDCVVDLLDEDYNIILESQSVKTMPLKTDGDSMSFEITGENTNYEVLMVYYKSEIEDDGNAQKLLQVTIADLKKDIQLDYLSLTPKKFSYRTELSGMMKDSSGNSIPFSAANIECTPY